MREYGQCDATVPTHRIQQGVVMATRNLFFTILLAFAGAVADAPTAPKRLADLGAVATSPGGVMKLFVVALKHEPDVRMAQLVAPAGADDERFVAEYDALSDAVARLRAAAA